MNQNVLFAEIFPIKEIVKKAQIDIVLDVVGKKTVGRYCLQVFN